MVGYATSGSAERGSCRYAIRPTTRIATISRVVATGRSMNRRDGFMGLQLLGLALALLRSAALAFGAIMLAGQAGRLLRMLRRVGWQKHRSAVPQPVAPFGDD